MRVGGESVTLALLAAPKISAGGLIRLLPILVKRQQEESAFRIYTAEGLRTMTENTAKFAGGSFVQTKYSDLYRPEAAGQPNLRGNYRRHSASVRIGGESVYK